MRKLKIDARTAKALQKGKNAAIKIRDLQLCNRSAIKVTIGATDENTKNSSQITNCLTIGGLYSACRLVSESDAI